MNPIEFLILYTFSLSIKNNSGLNVIYCQWCGLFFTFSPVLFFILCEFLILYTQCCLILYIQYCLILYTQCCLSLIKTVLFEFN